MLKIVVFDGGYGGELFADLLEDKLGVIAEIIRVIDWRNAKAILENPKRARKCAEEALRQYIGSADLIFFASHLLSLTSLKYFRRRYKNQKFLGLKLPKNSSRTAKPALILTTRALTRTPTFYNYLFHFKTNKKVVTLDSWPALIDDGELTPASIIAELDFTIKKLSPGTIILAHSNFSDIKPSLQSITRYNIKVCDGFEDSVCEVCKALKLRGAANKKKR